MILLNVKGRLTPDNDKTNIYHTFTVPDGLKCIKLSFSYSPKTLSSRSKAIKKIKECFEKYNEPLVGRPNEYLPVNNLLTISVDENSNYIGAAHRQDSTQEHIISEKLSSPGFIKTEIKEGLWCVCVNVHCVCCDVDYSLVAQGVEL